MTNFKPNQIMEGIPCNDCARAIIQSGTVRIVADSAVYAKYNKDALQESVGTLQERGVLIKYGYKNGNDN